MSSVKKLIELAEKGLLQCLDFENENEPKEHDILPILKCAERMAEAINAWNVEDGRGDELKVNILLIGALKEWNELNGKEET